MRATSIPPRQFADVFGDRIKMNREAHLDALDRLATVREQSRAARARSGTLRVEVRARLDQLAEGLAIARQTDEAAREKHTAKVGRYQPYRPDPIDNVRREIHETYAETRDLAHRQQLMESYDGFARSLAANFRHRESMDDLIQVARIGLLHAIDRFDPSLGRPFPVFARITITGELKRHLRDRTWGMRVPRSLQEDYLNVMRAVEDLTAEQSDSPSMEAVAERCGMTIERVLEAMELRVNQRALSIDAPTNPGSDDPPLDLGGEDLGFRHLENKELVGQLLGRLSERDRRIIELRFMHEMTQSEIAAEIGVSQMCVSRVLARTLGRLRLWARGAGN